MASKSLYTELVVINNYTPYKGAGKNHHHTKIGFNCQMLGDPTLVVEQKNIYYQLRQGNKTNATPETVEGTATSATSTRLYDTSKNFLTSDLSWLGESWWYPSISIVSGTGAGQSQLITYVGSNYVDVASWSTTPDNTSVYTIHIPWHRNRVEWEAIPPALHLQHDEWTIWTMMQDSDGVYRIAKSYININTLLQSLPGITNSKSPQIIFKKQDAVGGLSRIKVKATPGDTVSLYWNWQMDETKLNTLSPRVFQANITAENGKKYSIWRNRPFKSTPIASQVIPSSSLTGEYEFVVTATDIAADSNDRWVVVSATSPNMGESFSCASVKVFPQLMFSGVYTPDAEDMRQNKVIFTPSATTRPADGGGLERFYTVDVKNIDLYTGVETAYGSLSDFYLNLNNNGDVNNFPVTDGIWVKVGTTKTVLFVDQNANGATSGTPYSYWSTHIIDAGAPDPETKTGFTSLADAVTRGPNTLLPKDEVFWYSVSWDLNDKVYINNDATDETTPPDGYYFYKPLNMAYQLISGEIAGKQYIGGTAVY